LNDTFLQFSDTNEGKKKQVRLKAYCVLKDKLEGTTLLSDSEKITQKTLLLIGARVREKDARRVWQGRRTMSV
jgi:hypothetical protein